MTYKLHRSGKGVIHPDGHSIPEDLTNGEWQDHLAWKARGNIPLDPDPEPPTSEDKIAANDIRTWAIANPNARLLFNLPVAELETTISDLVDDLFRTANVPNRTIFKLILMTLILSVRVFAKRLSLLN